MYPPLSFAPLKAMLFATAEHITFAEIGVFMLFFLVFVFCFFLSLIFWHFKRVLFVFFLIETGILLCIPYSISKVSEHIIYPIEVHYERFRPFVYTTGFNYDIEITSKAKLPIKECLLTIVPKREGTNILPKPKNIAQSNQTEPIPQSNTESNVESNTQPNEAHSKQSQENTQHNTQSSTSSSQENNQIAQDFNDASDSTNTQDSSTTQIATTTSTEQQDKPADTKIAQADELTPTQTKESQEPQATKEAKDTKDAQESNDKQEPKPKKAKTPKPPSPYLLKFYKILDYIIPLDAFVEVLELDSPLKYNKKVRWQGIIRDYKYDENFTTQINCH